MALIRSLVNSSEETYKTPNPACLQAFPIAWSKCVFPKPTPPYRNRGLYAAAGFSATAKEAASASRLFAPTTKLSKVYRGLRFMLRRRGDTWE